MLKSFFNASSDLFNRAAGQFRSLRNLEAGSSAYSKAMFEAIKLCQQAIQKYPKDGDAHVLLANLYYLAAFDCFMSIGYPFFLARASAVMQAAKESRMYIKQRQIADKVFRGILEQLSSQNQIPDNEVLPLPNDLPQLRRDYYQKAIDSSFIVEMIAFYRENNIGG